MKKIYPLLLLGIFSFFSCEREDPIQVPETGNLTIDVGLALEINEIDSRLKSGSQTDNFKIIIYDTDSTEIMLFENVASMPDTIKLIPGDYFVIANSGNNFPAAFDNPYYYGSSGIFTISSGAQQSVEIICSLANTAISVGYSDRVMNSFQDYNTVVSTALDSLIYVKGETRTGYFLPSAMNILVELSYLNTDGSENIKFLSGSIPEPLANRHYEIFIDTSPDAGMAGFTILLDETAIPVEVVEINDDFDNPIETGFAYGDLLITEIMSDPSTLSDTEGEWFEIYNNSGRTINLQNLIMQRDDINLHTISPAIELLAGEYMVLQRSEQATAAGNSYVYGSDILLPNSGGVISIFNEETAGNPGSLIFSIDYGSTGFPTGSGSSIILNPFMMNPAEAISGTSWCRSTSIYNTGDTGTPGLVNDSCE